MHLRDQTTLDSYGQQAVAEPVRSLAETPCYLVAHVEAGDRVIPILGAQINELGGVPAIRQRVVHDRPRVSFMWSYNTALPPAQVYKGANIATAIAHPGTRAMIWEMFGLGQLRDAFGNPVSVIGYAPTANTLAILPEELFGRAREGVLEYARRMPDPGAWVNFIARIASPTEPGWGTWVEDPVNTAYRARVAAEKATAAQLAAEAKAYYDRKDLEELSRRARPEPWWRKIL